MHHFKVWWDSNHFTVDLLSSLPLKNFDSLLRFDGVVDKFGVLLLLNTRCMCVTDAASYKLLDI